MGFKPYSTSVLLPADADTSNIPERLDAQLKGYDVRFEYGPGLPMLYFGDYSFQIGLDVEHPVGEDILEHNAQMLAQIGNELERARSYPFLLTFSGTGLDPDMDYFNDSLFLMQAIEELWPEAILYDTQSGERI